MERIGLIGGVSWVSTMEYYRRFNLIAQEAGGHKSVDLMVFSLDFSKILKCQKEDDFKGEFEILLSAAIKLECAGVTKILICSNTTSKTCDLLKNKISIPVINVIDATISAVKASGFKKVGLLGTKYVMERGFYVDRFGVEDIEVSLPEAHLRYAVHAAIYDDLCLHNFSKKAKSAVYRAMDNLIDQGVESLILGCTELPLIVDERSEYGGVDLIDSIDVHIAAALGRQRVSRGLGG